MIARYLFFAVLTTCVSSVASAGLITSEDHPVFGVDSLTRDHTGGLDFLDLSFSVTFSFNEVSALFDPGDLFEGFRYATEVEVLNLINNFGFSPTATAGVQTTGDTGGDQLSGLVDLVTSTSPAPGERGAFGITGTPVGGFLRLTALKDLIAGGADDVVNSNFTLEPGSDAATIGSWLVLPSPEPGSITLFATGAIGLFGYGWRRQRQPSE